MKKLYAILTASFLTASAFSAQAVELPTGRTYCYPFNKPSDKNYDYSWKLATIYDIPTSGSAVDWHAFSGQLTGVTEVQSAGWTNGQFVAIRYNYGTYMYVADKSGSEWSYTNKTLSTQYPGGATDLATDPKTGEVYGWFWSGTRSLYALSFQLCKLDISTGTITPIGQTSTSYITGLSFDSSGTLWGITQFGQLEKISTTDGTLTDVGSPISDLNWKVTEIVPQSMCYDSASGKMLYAHVSSYSYYSKTTALYAIDLSDQTATQLYSLNGACLAGLYTPASFDAAVPGEVTDLKASNDGVSTDIALSFTMPSKTFGGTALTSAKYTVLLDGEATSHKNVSADGGSEVNITVASTAGTHSVAVYCSNLSGDGPEVSTDVFVGPDTPAAPQNVKLTFDGRDATISWEAPLGKNG